MQGGAPDKRPSAGSDGLIGSIPWLNQESGSLIVSFPWIKQEPGV